MEKQKIALSAVQPTGVFTLGNYLGAIDNWAKLQKEFKCIYFVANMHSITIKIDPKELKEMTQKIVAILIACGIDTTKSILFLQSDVCQHAELSWVLQCNTQFGELKRMTQFKDKSLKHADNVNGGLFSYPVLMAADILLYNTDVVPIGIDQKQHLELTKTIATRFNNIYGEVFKIPQAYISTTGAKIMSLSNPLKKMSKSDENKNSFISVLDPPETILEKFKKTVTDSGSEIVFDEEKKPGISNLINIYSGTQNISIKEVEEKFKQTSYKDFKTAVAEAVINRLKPIQEKYNDIINDKDFLQQVCKNGAEKATLIAKETLKKVYQKVGF